MGFGQWGASQHWGLKSLETLVRANIRRPSHVVTGLRRNFLLPYNTYACPQGVRTPNRGEIAEAPPPWVETSVHTHPGIL